MLKKTDYIIIGSICFILGFAFVSQYFAGKKVASLTQPETNGVMALEIEKVAKSNASLKLQVSELTGDYNDYLNSSDNNAESAKKVQEEIIRLDGANGTALLSGQGVQITISGEMPTANIIDLLDALKNIGAEAISINGKRINLNTFLSTSNYSSPVTVLALGNSTVLESALKRKGGIVEQISSKNVKVNVTKQNSIVIPVGEAIKFNYGKIVN